MGRCSSSGVCVHVYVYVCACTCVVCLVCLSDPLLSPKKERVSRCLNSSRRGCQLLQQRGRKRERKANLVIYSDHVSAFARRETRGRRRRGSRLSPSLSILSCPSSLRRACMQEHIHPLTLASAKEGGKVTGLVWGWVHDCCVGGERKRERKKEGNSCRFCDATTCGK